MNFIIRPWNTEREMEMLANGKGEREGKKKERQRERKAGLSFRVCLSVNSDNASPRRLETEITANRRAIINAAYCF